MNPSLTQTEKQALYDAWWIAEVDKGLADIAAGRVMSDAQTQAGMEMFFANLTKELNAATYLPMPMPKPTPMNTSLAMSALGVSGPPQSTEMSDASR